ncbi:hypothetical protein B0H15DRAFT_948050 [Mycena belliarum]|uniref:Uncharacterized protein n=1 Tax=Mycena belliarum TaxID=1033014 RepID=A0AAD6U6T6_9AGAR|nr:hypothetical protein B0H15DRAFT_948050 [Mycena belliae]
MSAVLETANTEKMLHTYCFVERSLAQQTRSAAPPASLRRAYALEAEDSAMADLPAPRAFALETRTYCLCSTQLQPDRLTLPTTHATVNVARLARRLPSAESADLMCPRAPWSVPAADARRRSIDGACAPVLPVFSGSRPGATRFLVLLYIHRMHSCLRSGAAKEHDDGEEPTQARGRTSKLYAHPHSKLSIAASRPCPRDTRTLCERPHEVHVEHHVGGRFAVALLDPRRSGKVQIGVLHEGLEVAAALAQAMRAEVTVWLRERLEDGINERESAVMAAYRSGGLRRGVGGRARQPSVERGRAPLIEQAGLHGVCAEIAP